MGRFGRRREGAIAALRTRTGTRGLSAYVEALAQRQPERDGLRELIDDAEAGPDAHASERRPGAATLHAEPDRGGHGHQKKKPQVIGMTCDLMMEPPSGFEPETYALRVRCSGHLS